MPEVRVASKGVLVRGWMSAMYLKSRPSSAMAQITLGIGNMAPSKLGREGERVIPCLPPELILLPDC